MTVQGHRYREVEAFYRAHHTRLEQKVAKRVSGPGRAVIEDACQFAWTVLLRRPDINLDSRGLAWMTLIAAREAWRATAATAEPPVGRYAFSGARDVLSEHGGPPGPTLEDRIIDRERHHQRCGDLAALKPAERQALGLHAVGYTYMEIAELTGASFTAVNRRLTEGRARLRRLARQRAAQG
jgi:DNA-directed RNA polymerase specialized sigma24 family protein